MDEPTSAASTRIAGVPAERLPRHVAVIMDGNGRWAQRQGLPRIEGHRHGVDSVRCVTEECARLGIEQLTLYCLSSENWKRPREELDFLMHLLEQYLVEQRSAILRENVRLHVIGRREGLPERVLTQLDKTIEMSRANTGLRVCLAINYGARAEIVDAVRRIGREIQRGRLDPDTLTEDDVADHLDTAGMPDPDLLIRTAGEMRLSNYLLWQISYAEIWVTDATWPEFDKQQFHRALRAFASRNRRFGGLLDLEEE
ncbi:MAG: isoprenyl transferase [Pirellulales bacterium]|nr:isoprenyl transferase [Pirellulales bacterium]